MLIGVEVARLLREYGTGETPQAQKRRGGSPNRPRKAKRLERKSTGKFNKVNYKGKKIETLRCAGWLNVQHVFIERDDELDEICNRG
jgi:hypothetical protein